MKNLPAIELTPEQILSLTSVDEHPLYVSFYELSILEPLHGIDLSSVDNLMVTDSLRVRSYVRDLCNDNRARTLEVIFYKYQPFAIYQYVGRGNYENEAIIDEEVYRNFVQDLLMEYVQKKAIQSTLAKTDPYVVRNYDTGVFSISDNVLISHPREGLS